ncbi:MAG TPA: response regulator transcription factor [Saprospiraceae bacterium]|nr:response regulator transcription factor [Saprospiraceae bacterium]
MRVLLVEDESEIRALMKFNLELEGHEVFEAPDGQKALDWFQSTSFDIIVLDLMLPFVDGLEICRRVREVDQHTKIIIVSARDGVQDRILGLKLGADDYLSKPFHLEEFLLRVNNLTKRRHTDPSELKAFSFGDNTIYFDEFKARSGTREINLTPKEVALLKCLVEHKNKVIARKQILQDVWGYDVYPSTRTIDNFILSFRKYFEPNAKEPVYFHTIRGVGYKFTP